MKNLIIPIFMMLGVVSILCSNLKNIPDDVENYKSFQYHGVVDSNVVIIGKFLNGNNTLIFIDNHDTIPIWGKKCEFNKGDSIYSYGELWSSHKGCYCKYFVINSNRTLKYPIIK